MSLSDGSLEQQQDGAQVHKGQERFVQLVIARKDPPAPLELLEEAFDQMAFLIQIIVCRPEFDRIAFGGIT